MMPEGAGIHIYGVRLVKVRIELGEKRGYMEKYNL